MANEIVIPFICFNAGTRYIEVQEGDDVLLGLLVAYTQDALQRVEFDIVIHSGEWNEGKTITWALTDCPETGCDIFVYKDPDGKIVAHCSDCHNERGPRIE